MPYYHVVFTLPAAIGDIAYQNKAVIYDLLFKAAAETLITIAADPKHLGARIGLTAVLHTWGSALTHHPHVHIIVPGGGISPDGQRWISCRPGFFLPVRVLSRLFRRLFLEKLVGRPRRRPPAVLRRSRPLAEPAAFAAYLAPLRKAEWVVYAKRPFGGPEAVLAYLSRYTHRVAIANSRLIAFDDNGVTFKWKDYRANGRRARYKVDDTRHRRVHPPLPHPRPARRLPPHPPLWPFANGGRAENIARARQLLNVPTPQSEPAEADSSATSRPQALAHPCPCCGGRMIIIETFERGSTPRIDRRARSGSTPHERRRPVAKPEPRPQVPLPSTGHSLARPVAAVIGHPTCSAPPPEPRQALARPNDASSCRRRNPAITTLAPNPTGSGTQIPIT